MNYNNSVVCKKSGRYAGPAAAFFLVVFVVVLMGGCARTPEITDGEGKELSGSIAVMEEIELMGVKQWIVMRGTDKTAPVLLWVAGGPGGSELGWTRKYLADLEKDVVFVNWEQPGTGKSFGAVSTKDMDVSDYVDHLIALSDYLKERFNKEKILVAGHSWGSIIGLMAAERRPDLYHAYIGIGQQVNSVENDRIGYNLVLDRAEAAGDTKIVDTLKKNGPPPYTVEEKGKYTVLFQKLFVYSPHASSAEDFKSMSMLTPKEYSPIDSLNLIRGLLQGVNYIYPQLERLDFEKQIPRLEVPVFFITGRYDYTCVQDIAYRYYEELNAPAKEFYWFENSGHNSCYVEREKFISIMREDIIPLADTVSGKRSESHTLVQFGS
jgi:pimeloyl-ACP methyl ester carboxylesterase